MAENSVIISAEKTDRDRKRKQELIRNTER